MGTCPEARVKIMQAVKIDFALQAHRNASISLLNIYAQDLMGGGQSLTKETLSKLPDELSRRSFVHGFLIYDADIPIGLALCMEGFSTFACRPLINIHDFVVIPEYRNKGIASLLLQAVEDYAQEIGCCKITLEVLQGNLPAQKAYKKFGFKAYELDREMGHALFWHKTFT